MRDGGDAAPLDADRRAQIGRRYQEWSGKGFRVRGVATKELPRQLRYIHDDENALTFVGFLLFFDPPKPGVLDTISGLAAEGVRLKSITGDNRLVALHTAETIGMAVTGLLTGSQLNDLRDEALWQAVEQTNVFVEVDPNQKERMILALQKTGHVVGYMGDGINDAPALHAADVGISVHQAVDVAKEAAEFVLLERDLGVLQQGIKSAAIPSTTCSSTCLSRRAPTSATCSAWPARRCSCLSCPCCLYRSCSS